MKSYIELKAIDQWLFKGLGGILNLFQARLLKNQETKVATDRLQILRECLTKLKRAKLDLESRPNIEITPGEADTLMVRGFEALVDVIRGRAIGFGSFDKLALTELESALERLPKLLAGANVLNERLEIKSETKTV